MLAVWDRTQFGAIQHSVMLCMNMAFTSVTVPIAGVGRALFSIRHLMVEIGICCKRSRSAQ